ncbi:MAG: portal protein [Lentisphaeria bacterium]|nr:MAG: portal protein [Lentisphaeria bacterium]
MEEFSAQAIISNLEILRGNRTGLNEKLEQVASFLSPAKFGAMTIDRSGSMSRNEPERRPRQIVCDFAQEAANTFTRGLFSNLFPPSVRWFSYSLSYPEQKNLPEEFKRYFASASQTTYDLLYATNWTTEMSEICECPSTGTVYHVGGVRPGADSQIQMPSPVEHLLHFFRRHDDRHRLRGDSAHRAAGTEPVRKERRPARETAARRREERRRLALGEALHDHPFCHAQPEPEVPHRRTERAYHLEPVQGPEGKRFLSFYVEKEEKLLIRRGGFDHNPYTVGRDRQHGVRRLRLQPGAAGAPDDEAAQQNVRNLHQCARRRAPAVGDRG